MCFQECTWISETLLRLLEDWKGALDKNEYVAAVIMDLSKAFDCLPHDILLSQLSAYGLCADSVELLKSYLSGRKQQVKINNIASSWSEIKKGFGSLVILDVARCYLWLFTLYINIKISKNSC